MISKTINLLDKVRAVKSPLRLKKYALDFIARVFSQIYDSGMLVIDRTSSVVFVPLYDLYDLLRKKNANSVEVMVCRHQYYSDDGNQESTEKMFLDNTLANYLKDRSKIAVYYWDDNQPVVGFSINFYRNVVSLNPKYLILSSWAQGVFYQPMPWILARLKKRNIRVVVLWWDTCYLGFVKSVSPVINVVDVHGILDNPTLNLGESHEAQLLKEKTIVLLCPYAVDIEERERDIDVAFLGQVSSYRDNRKTYLHFLFENNIALFISTNDRNQQCSHEMYYETLSRAKIGLNFSMSANGPQFKGRVIETMLAGSLLLDERNKQTACYFSEGEDYVAFSSKKELLEKIKYYLAHEDERKMIAESGQRKAKQLTNGKQFWDKVLTS